MSTSTEQFLRLYLLDRNVVALIKDDVAGKMLTDKKKLRYLEFLKAIDIPTSCISPLLSLVEGEKGREDNAEEKAACQKKESEALRQFFSVASHDSDLLDALRNVFAACFSTYQEGQWHAREKFFQQVAPLMAQQISTYKKPAIEKKLICAATSAGLPADDALLILCLACLYGSDDARKVIKPHKPAAYNVLSDLHVISRIGMIKAVAKEAGIPIVMRFVTMDGGLEGVLSNIRIVEPTLHGAHGLKMKLRWLPKLFPDLNHASYCALMSKLTS